MKSPLKKYNFYLLLVFILALFLIITFWYSRVLFDKVADDERLKVKNWAAAVQRQAKLVSYVRVFFTQMEEEERKFAVVWSLAYQKLLSEHTPASEYEDYFKIVEQNKSIPIILTDNNRNIIEVINADIDPQKTKKLIGTLFREYSVNKPIEFKVVGDGMRSTAYFMYYKPSKLFEELKLVMGRMANSFIDETVDNSVSVPVIITNTAKNEILFSGNVQDKNLDNLEGLRQELSRMGKINSPIEIEVFDKEKLYIYYESSSLLRNLNYIPFFLLMSIMLIVVSFVFLVLFSKKAEENLLWVGMSKETAHQLGTPLSSLMAWLDIFREKTGEPIETAQLDEIEKDIERLEVIANRFSKIGSIPELKKENLISELNRSVSYLQARSSKKIKYSLNYSQMKSIELDLNSSLFEWVIENLCKNSINAIGDNAGEIGIFLEETPKYINIDLSDTGKGMSKKVQNQAFHPGFTTKQRGWGLGLTLCKRIIEEYHGGKIIIKSSSPKVGTTFRISLKK